MGSPITAMLGNAAAGGGVGVGGGSQQWQEYCAANPQDPNCPQQQPPGGGMQPPGPGEQPPQAPAGPSGPSVTELGLMKAASPQLAGTMTPPEAAGAQAYQQVTPQVEALQAQQPDIAQMLKMYFGL